MNTKMFIKHFKNIYFRGVSSFGTLPNVNYPYVFKGLLQNQVPHYSSLNEIKRMFGNDVEEGFKAAYKNIVEALKDKDSNFLNANLENTLTRNIKLQDV